MTKYISTDSDGDGLPDAWEQKYFGTLSYGPNDDPGGVGRTLLQSYQQGLSPWPSAVVSNGLRAWYRADLGVSKDSNNKVSGWADLSGNGMGLTQVVMPSLQPTWESNAFNGQAAMLFNQENLQTTKPVDLEGGQSDVTMIVVMRPPNTAGDYARVIDLDSTDGSGRTWLQFDEDRFVANKYGLGWYNGAQTAAYSAPSVEETGGRVEMLTSEKSGTQAMSYINGVLQGSTTVDGTLGMSPGMLYMGQSSGGGYAYNGEIAEVLVYNRALSDAERQQIENALQLRYNFLPTPVVSNGLRAWYRADLGVSKDSNNKVSGWADLSSNGMGLTQVVRPSLQPTWESNAFNGQAAMLFNQENLQTTKPVDLEAGQSDVTMIVVMRPPSSASGGARVLDLNSTDGSGRTWLQLNEGRFANMYNMGWYNSAQTTTYGTPTAIELAGNVEVLTMEKSGTQAQSFLNGVSNGSIPVDGTLGVGVGQLYMGQYAGGGYAYNGEIAEVLMYNRALSDAERQQIEQQLMTKYISSDSDGDGLPDTWEQKYLGTLSYGPNDDPGGVGRTLLQSYQQGLSPWPSAVVSNGLRAWYRADVGVVKDVNNKVSEWADISGNGVSLVQVLQPQVEPTWETGAFNGAAAIQFNSSVLQTLAPVDLEGGQSDVTMIVVMRPPNTAGDYARVITLNSIDGSGRGWLQFDEDRFVANKYGLSWYNGAQTSTYSAPSVTEMGGKVEVLTSEKSGAQAMSYLNGVLQGSTPVDGTLGVSPGMLYMGQVAGGGYAYNGEIAEVLVYNRALSDAESSKWSSS